MRALAVGVVARSRHPAFTEGEFVYGWFDWQDYAAIDAAKVLLRGRWPLPLPDLAGLLGINGLTAYLALTALGRPVRGNTLLVSTAAGARWQPRRSDRQDSRLHDERADGQRQQGQGLPRAVRL
jgi:NADPH-dependent curcumin reductase CurA